VVQAYQFALDPTPEQEAMLRSHCGAQRYAFNWGLARVKANLGQREAEKSYGLTAEDLTPALSWSAWSLRNDWNQAKTGVAPWWAENSKEAYAGGLANLAAGLANWKDSRAGKRKRPEGPVPSVQGEAGRAVVPVQHWGVRLGRRRAAACAAAPDRGDPHP
jgi:putative transposase